MTATLTEAEAIATGRTILARTAADDFTWPSDARACTSLHACRDGVRDSRRDYLNVKAGRIHPGAIFPELEHDDDAYDTALRKLADDVLAWARAAVLVVAEHVGPEAAEALKAAEVGAQS
jgi:hypothetical protein